MEIFSVDFRQLTLVVIEFFTTMARNLIIGVIKTKLFCYGNGNLPALAVLNFQIDSYVR